ncbi:hypothetical protein [Brevibacterium sp. UCMA 11752]|uniref:hypothetical protein n=1 Tax=Brevibacterium sp. UCMA 11752 TaxID=2745946 RepID=UPI001F4494DC|nr:hypothetical protein [Brevibacterium sp. UCMA 11752]MCF2586866.1 hypothetical protein [Brevibacterium sp. UCMA 11752]
MLTSCHVDRPGDVLTIEWSLPHDQPSVWEHLTAAAMLHEWLGQPTTFDARVGGEIIVDHGDGYLCRSEVLSLTHDGGQSHGSSAEVSWEFPDEPQSRLCLRTFDPDYPDNDTSNTGDNTPSALVIQHSGLGTLIDSYLSGWLTHLTYFEASLSETPLPPEQFWPLCATFEQLCVPWPEGAA